MKVILCKDMPKMGKTGDIVSVRDGYARNYLIPQGVALRATDANIKKIELAGERQIKELNAKKQELALVAEKMSGASVNIEAEATDDDKLYGAVGPAQIAAALKNEGFPVEEDQIDLPEPIKALGIYEASVKLSSDISAKIKVWVVRR